MTDNEAIALALKAYREALAEPWVQELLACREREQQIEEERLAQVRAQACDAAVEEGLREIAERMIRAGHDANSVRSALGLPGAASGMSPGTEPDPP